MYNTTDHERNYHFLVAWGKQPLNAEFGTITFQGTYCWHLFYGKKQKDPPPWTSKTHILSYSSPPHIILIWVAVSPKTTYLLDMISHLSTHLLEFPISFQSLHKIFLPSLLPSSRWYSLSREHTAFYILGVRPGHTCTGEELGLDLEEVLQFLKALKSW